MQEMGEKGVKKERKKEKSLHESKKKWEFPQFSGAISAITLFREYRARVLYVVMKGKKDLQCT